MKSEPPSASLLHNGVMLIQHLDLALRFDRRFLGYMGKPAPPTGHALYLAPCRSIHTFFMRFPLDLIFVDRELRIVRLVRNLPPWRIARGGRLTFGVIEIPVESDLTSGLHPGDKLVRVLD